MTTIPRGRLLEAGAGPPAGEHVEVLATIDGVVVEQILSGELPSPVDFLQDHAEWVVLLSGRARLEVDQEPVDLTEGDWVLLPERTPHRLLWTEPGTSWLALHVPPGRSSRR
jgi:cupin 2 domain-containing protein